MDKLPPISFSAGNDKMQHEPPHDQLLVFEPFAQSERLADKLRTLLALAKAKPHISYWGEIYYLLYLTKKTGDRQRKNIVLYDLPSGKMTYAHEQNRFVAMVPDMNIMLEDHELTDALLKGMFVPSVERNNRLSD